MFSIVIPVLHTDSQLRRALVATTETARECEVVVIAAGSTEETAELALLHRATFVVSGLCQRAAQMNLGAETSAGAILVFLHADTMLPKGALERIESALRDQRVIGGAFARHYEPASAFLNATCFLAELRSRMFGWFLGDQAMFVRRDVFERLGGFRDYDIFEDLDFARRMRREGRVVTLRPPVVSSARRFHRDGAFRKTLSDVCLTLRYVCGADPNQLAREINARPSPPPLAARSQPDAPCPRASPIRHCKDEPCPSVGHRGPMGDSRSPTEKSNPQGS